MLTDRPGLTAGTTASAAAEPLLFPSLSLCILYKLPVCLISLSFYSVSHPPLSHYLFLSCLYTIFLSFLRPTLHKPGLRRLLPVRLMMTSSFVVNLMS